MEARLVTIPIQPDKLDEAVQIFERTAVPAIKAQPGLQQLVLLSNAESGDLLILTLWESDAARQAALDSGFVKAQIQKVLHLATGAPTVQHLATHD